MLIADLLKETGLSRRTINRLLADGVIKGEYDAAHRLHFAPSVLDRIRELYKLPLRDCATCGGQHGESLDPVIQNHEDSVANLLLHAYDSCETHEELAIWRKHFGANRGTPMKESFVQFRADLRVLRGAPRDEAEGVAS